MKPASPELAIETTEVHNIYLRVSVSVPALEPLDLRVLHHSIHGFLGPDGAGETPTKVPPAAEKPAYQNATYTIEGETSRS